MRHISIVLVLLGFLTITAMLSIMTNVSIFADNIILMDRPFFRSLTHFHGHDARLRYPQKYKDMKSATQVYNYSELTKPVFFANTIILVD